MTNWIVMGVAVVAVTVAGGALWKYNTAITEAERLRGENSTLTTALGEQTAQTKLAVERGKMLDSLLKEKADNEELLRNALARFDRNFSQLRREDPVVREWADTPVPPALLDLMRPEATAGR